MNTMKDFLAYTIVLVKIVVVCNIVLASFFVTQKLMMGLLY
jgi:hypothetical protein